jgi:hypothetical protein
VEFVRARGESHDGTAEQSRSDRDTCASDCESWEADPEKRVTALDPDPGDQELGHAQKKHWKAGQGNDGAGRKHPDPGPGSFDILLQLDERQPALELSQSQDVLSKLRDVAHDVPGAAFVIAAERRIGGRGGENSVLS